MRAVHKLLLHKPKPGASFGPLSLGATLRGWWDFSDATTLYTDAGTTPVANDGDLIYQANDKSGNNRHLTQATAGNRPLYKTNIQGGQSVAQFGGVTDDDYLDGTGSASLTAVSVVSVGMIRAIVNNICDPTPILSATATYDYVSGVVQVEDNCYLTGTQIMTFTAGTATTPYIYARRHSQGIHNTYRNGGTALGTGNKTSWSFAWNIIRVGARYSALTPALDGWVGETLVCDTYLSDANLNLLGAYLAAKYGLTWTDI